MRGEIALRSHSVQHCLASWVSPKDSGIAHHRQYLYHGNYQEMLTISIAKLIVWYQPSQLIPFPNQQPHNTRRVSFVKG